MKKLIYIVSDIDKALAFEWTADQLKSLFALDFILIGKNNTVLEEYLQTQGINHYIITDKEYPGHIRKWFKIIELIGKIKPDIVHTHLWRATLLGITASWLLSVNKRIFTRHHATLHYDQHPSGRKWDQLCNRLATDIVAVSENIKLILVERDKADPGKIQVIHHGFNLKEFIDVKDERVDSIRARYNISGQFPVIGIISRYTYWKGIQYSIEAFRQLKQQYPQALLVLANARGEYKEEITKSLGALAKEDYREIEF
ncbi:MAG TPA: glycosyltransferase family 4 protein, partial [Cyclobacteriaceae bacterium]